MPRTFDIFDHVDDWHYMGLHDWIKQNKWGYGRVVDQLTREIRHGRLQRNAAIKLMFEYQSQPIQNADLLYEWLGIQEAEFRYVVKRHSKSISSSFLGSSVEECDTDMSALCLKPSNAMKHNYLRQHVTIGKGYPD